FIFCNFVSIADLSLILFLQPLCGSDPILVLDFSMRVLERHPSETIELFLSGGVPPDLVNSYLKQHSPQMQATYLEHMLSMNEHGITANLQNELRLPLDALYEERALLLGRIQQHHLALSLYVHKVHKNVILLIYFLVDHNVL
ncbi:hypothetical protein EJ110_NYTH46489, partial [Nymphaea thermarum]